MPLFSPILSNSNPAKKLREFFQFVSLKPQWHNKVEILKLIKETLIKDKWDLEGLQKDIISKDWQEYSYSARLLPRLRRELKSFRN